MSLVELTTVRDCGLSDVRFANAAEHRRKVSREFDIIIRSERRSLLRNCTDLQLIRKFITVNINTPGWPGRTS